ncbi:MAG: hypothetical protein HKO63_06110 [Acidimicrobiia bacterium]|nr:hypothetical protein [Acidimicrobiia bacterium]NNJ47024.1 hypothetical protein [Acidimicrobiia bacterium]NNL97762.1 hypothetical protein [Acidimicrobiia bacterium]
MTKQRTALILLVAMVASACAAGNADTSPPSTATTSPSTTQPPPTTQPPTTTSTAVSSTTTTTIAEDDPDALAWAYLATDPDTGYPMPDLRGEDIVQIIRDTWAYFFWQLSDPAAAHERLEAGGDITYHPECDCYSEDLEGFKKLADEDRRYFATAGDYEVLHINLLSGSVEENGVLLYVVASWNELQQADADGNPVPDGTPYSSVSNWRPGNPGSAYFAVSLQRVSAVAPWQHRVDRLEGFFPQDHAGTLAGIEILLDGGKITLAG